MRGAWQRSRYWCVMHRILHLNDNRLCIHQHQAIAIDRSVTRDPFFSRTWKSSTKLRDQRPRNADIAQPALDANPLWMLYKRIS